MFAIHNLTLKDMVNNVLPSSLPLSSEQLDSTGVFLLENGKDVFIYVGKTVSVDVLQQLFGVQSVDDISDQFLL
jgi:protein transport protein SEC24